MLSTIETALFSHVRDVVLFLQKDPCSFHVPMEKDSRNNGSRHDLRIAHLALRIFVML